MISLSLILLLLGIILNRYNLLIAIMILEIFYLILSIILILLENEQLPLFILCITATETVIGFSLILFFYKKKYFIIN